MKNWIIRGFIIFLALMNLYVVTENKTLISKELAIAEKIFRF